MTTLNFLVGLPTYVYVMLFIAATIVMFWVIRTINDLKVPYLPCWHIYADGRIIVIVADEELAFHLVGLLSKHPDYQNAIIDVEPF